MLRHTALLGVLASALALDNRGVVFVKPHAATQAAVSFTAAHLERHGVAVLGKCELRGEDIAERGIIDKHYMALARNALGGSKPNARTVDPALVARAPEEAQKAFQEAFGTALAAVEEEGRILRADVALEELELEAEELEARWREGASVKLGPGCYISDISPAGSSSAPFFAINGFYPTLRAKFTRSDAAVPLFLVSFSPAQLSWRDFRRKVIGATNPEKAESGSLRAGIRDAWEDLGLPGEPNVSDNGVHASAGPLEALRETKIWGQDLGAGVQPLEEELRGLPGVSEALGKWLEDEEMELEGRSGAAFDLTEEMDADVLLEKLGALVP